MARINIYHPGTQHIKRLCHAFLMYNHKVKLFTGLLVSDKKKLPKIFGNRKTSLPANVIYNNYAIEIIYHFLNKIAKPERSIWLRNYLFQFKYSLLRNFNDKKIIIGFDTSSYLLFKNHQQSFKILDQTSPESFFCEEISKGLKNKYSNLTASYSYKNDKLLNQEKTEHSLANIVVTASTFTKKTLMNAGVDEAKIITIPYGVDLNKFEPALKNYDQKIIYLYVGQISFNKGLPLLLNTWAKLNLNNAELWLVGDLLDHSIKKLINSSVNIKYYGKVLHSDLKKIYNEAHVFVFPTYFDGFGLVLLEAMASGLAIISSINSAAPDLITPNEEGYLFDPFKEEELAYYLKITHQNKNIIKEMGIKSLQKATKFSWSSYAAKWHHLIETKTC